LAAIARLNHHNSCKSELTYQQCGCFSLTIETKPKVQQVVLTMMVMTQTQIHNCYHVRKAYTWK